jgi:cytoskeletal protein RodZ
MNKKAVAILGVVALGVGGVSTIALQSHAQQVVNQPTAPVVQTPAVTKDVSSSSDTDNIQNDKGGVDQPDAVMSGQKGTDTETADDATTTVKKTDTKEQGEGTATDSQEVEDAN